MKVNYMKVNNWYDLGKTGFVKEDLFYQLLNLHGVELSNEARTIINHVWLSRSGDVITADSGMTCYSTETRPIDAPTKEEDRYWETPSDEDAEPL
jgi:hypothetical protein